MRDLGRRLLIGLGVVAAAVMAIGYAFIAGGIATPLATDLGTFAMPEEAGAQAVLLADGRPAFIVASEGDVTVIDARGRHGAGAPGRLVAWCEAGFFLDLVEGATYDATGQLMGGPAADGLVVHAVRSVDDGSRFVVGGDGVSAGSADGEPVALDCPTSLFVHRPDRDETFDPSVAADEEPPGWIWLEGRLRAEAGEAILCDGLDGDCATFAPVGGIDPALIPSDEHALIGSFVGRVRDGVIAELNFVPDPGGPS